MKKLFTSGLPGARKRSDEGEQGNTIDRLVRDKEGVRKRLEEDEKEFILRRREYVENLVALEKQEVMRREKELEKKRADFVEKKRLNQQVKDKFVEQMKLLEMKLDEVKQDHLRAESEMELEIESLEDKLSEVVSSLQDKMGELEPSAPEADRDLAMYPDLNSFSRSISLNPVGLDKLNHRHSAGSAGSSPQISITSTVSAVSNASNVSTASGSPKNDSD